MSLLRVYLFGGVRICHDGQTELRNLPRTIQGLLAYLLIKRHRLHPREALASVFWGEQGDERARNCLSTALWRLRAVTEPPGIGRNTYIISTPAGEVGFNSQSNYWLDAEAFEQTLNPILSKSPRSMDSSDASNLQEALSLHATELVEGFYDDWALVERERLRSIYVRGLARLMHFKREARAWEESLAYGKQILDLEPLREEIHRDLMRIYVAKDERALAIRQYQVCCKILEDELGVPPMEETQALYSEILSLGKKSPKMLRSSHKASGDSSPAMVHPDAAQTPISLEHVFWKLQTASEDFRRVQSKLDKATQLLSRLMKQS